MVYAVPTTHVLHAAALSLLFCAGAACPTVALPQGGAPAQFAYAQAYLGKGAGGAQFLWGEVGWAALAVAVAMVLAAGAMALLGWAQRRRRGPISV
jgi:hypothetical protein